MGRLRLVHDDYPYCNYYGVASYSPWTLSYLDLAISPPKAEEEKDKDKDVTTTDDWAPPKTTTDPKDF